MSYGHRIAPREHADLSGATKRRYGQARRDWLGAHELSDWHPVGALPPLLRLRGEAPWSFVYLAEHDPERLAAKLAFALLPPRWTPTRVDSWDYGPSLLPEPWTYETFTQMRQDT